MLNLLLLPIALLLLWFLAGFLSARHVTGRQPDDKREVKLLFEVEDVTITTEDGLKLSAWFIDNYSDKAVILLAGIGCDRSYMVNRAENYIREGYSVLLPDLRTTGQSEGELISFGWHERLDLVSCYHFLKRRNILKIGAHGSSLGAATIVYSLTEIKDYLFLVLESCYDNIHNALRNRVAKYYLPQFIYFPFSYFTERRINIKSSHLYPEEYIKHASAPTLLMAGDSEGKLKLEETYKLFENCGAKEKNLHIFKGGKHEDFKLRFEEEYNDVLDSFLKKLNV